MKSPALTQLLSRPKDERRLGPFVLDDARKLGEGGFAPVYLADEVHAGVTLRTVALKVFSLGEAPDSDASSAPKSKPRYTQIVEEARALCRVEHPNVVRFYALPTNDDLGLIGLAMEHVEGTSLEERLKTGPLSVAQTLEVGESVASALSAVHRAGLVHRDVKPANVIDAGGVYKLIDFGIASAESTTPKPPRPPPTPVLIGDFMIEPAVTQFSVGGNGATTAASVAGTMGYIDPVCLRTGAGANAASDLYALGATLFECLTGKLPASVAVSRAKLPEKDRAELFQRVLCGEAAPPSLAEVKPDLPKGLSALVDALLSPEVAKRPRSAEAVAHAMAGLRADLKGAAHDLPSEDVGPFRGLGRFEESDQDLFFGRSPEIAATVEFLRARSFVALVGPSGSGKSSLARAGVAPAIAHGALGAWPAKWRQVLVTPGREPYEAWCEALAPIVPKAKSMSTDALATALQAHVEQKGEGVLLVVDQLEELVTLSEPASQKRAVDLIVRLSETTLPGLRVLAAARRDLLDDLFALPPEFGRLLSRGMQLVSPLTDATWEDVLHHALAAYGYDFEDAALRKEVLDELRGTIGAMPLVQFALTRLWEQRDRDKKVVSRAGLRKMGGIAGALERHAEATFSELASMGLEDRARKILLALTTPQGTRARRERTALEGETADVTRILDVFTRARLVVEEPDGFTIAHEALLTQWKRMRAWLDAVRSDRQAAEELERAAQSWKESHDDTLLWRKRRLANAVELLRSGLVEVSPRGRSFVDVGRAAERNSRVMIGVGVSALAAIGLFVASSYFSRIQEEQKKTAVALEDARTQRDAAESAKLKAQQGEAVANSLKSDAETARKDAESLKQKFQTDLRDLEHQIERAKSTADFEELKAKVKGYSSAPETRDDDVDPEAWRRDIDPVGPTVLNEPRAPPEGGAMPLMWLANT